MKLVKYILLASLLVLLSGCNTARGVGADLEVLGRKMQGLNSNQVVVEGLPTQNVVEVPTTYQSNQSYQSGNTSPSYDSYSADSYSDDTYSDDSYSSAQTDYQQDSQVYSTPYEGDTTYTTLPDAVTYPMGD